VGLSNYEDGLTNGGCLRIVDLQRKVSGESVMGQLSSTGPLAMADFDGDGTLDLFLGGRVRPGRYPEPADSLLLRNQGGRFVVAQRWEELGLVSGAVWSDLDGDGWPDLVLACEWGPVRVFHNQRGKLAEVTEQVGLAEYVGWWNGVATGDLDGDGRMDIVASNWGLNSKYHPSQQWPVRLHYGDLDESGTVDVIESYVDPATGREVPNRGLRPVAAALPFIRETITSFEGYGQARLQEIYGDRLKQTRVVEANTLASTMFLNRGNRFEASALPGEAQWAPAYGVCIGDFDGDGAEDIFLAQNFFAVNPDDWRKDAGRGLWLKGNGAGHFEPVRGQESGVKVYGEQRGCALADYDGDGRVDLAVTQNANATKLFRNQRAKPGLRVRLAGPPQNPNQVGACLRLKWGERFGAAQEVQLGSGYWSCNGAVQVMASPEPPTRIWVRWPGGKTTTSDVPSGAKEISVEASGAVKSNK
jgi:hypothetical protein